MDVTITELEEVTWSHVIWVAEEIQDSQYNGLCRIGGDRAQTPKTPQRNSIFPLEKETIKIRPTFT